MKRPQPKTVLSMMFLIAACLEQAYRQAARAEEKFYRARAWALEVLRLIARDGKATLPVSVPRPEPEAPPGNRILEAAAAGIRRYRVLAQLNGRTTLQLDDEEVTLSSRPAFLIQALAADDRPSEDHLVGWKPRTEIRERFTKQFGVPMSARYLNALVHRLSVEMRLQAGLDRDYIRKDAAKGLRLARRRPQVRLPGAGPALG